MTSGNFYRLSKVMDTPHAQPSWQACRKGCAKRLWKSLVLHIELQLMADKARKIEDQLKFKWIKN